MKVIILGANGMLGHKLFQELGRTFEIIGTIRGTFNTISRYGFYKKSLILTNVDAVNLASVEKALQTSRPDVAVNCIGVVKAISEASGPALNVGLNALFPHRLYALCRAMGIRLLHVSTDCVFSGRKGGYSEEDKSDAEDLYGKTKFLGEVTGPGAFTIRTSFIGRELGTVNGLLEWIIASRGKTVEGWANAIFSGFPTLHLARIIQDIIENRPDLSGLCHVSSNPISKYQLLVLINKTMGLNIKIKKSAEPRLDRSLDSSCFREKTGFGPLPWEQMVAEMAEDAKEYAAWR